MATLERTREERITEYVVRDAMCDVLLAVVECCDVSRHVDQAIQEDDYAGDLQGFACEMSAEVYSGLWPEDEDAASEECKTADRRVRALVTAILAQMATDDFRQAILDEITRTELLRAKGVA